MPIKASADKIKNEIAKYGNPPVFPVVDAEAEAKAAAEKAAEAAADAKNADPTKFVAKKSKAQAKAGTASYQWQIMQSSGIPDSDIPPSPTPTTGSTTSPPRKARRRRHGLPGGLAPILHHHRPQPLLRCFCPLAVQHPQEDRQGDQGQTYGRVLPARRPALRRPRPRHRRGRWSPGVHPHQDGGSGRVPGRRPLTARR